MTPPPLVLVQWEDALVRGDTTWVSSKDLEGYKPQIFYSVGFLITDCDEGVVLTPAWSPDMVAAGEQIPRGMIRSVTPLQPKRKR